VPATVPTATWLAVVRHGQSTWNEHGRWQGQADPPLSPLGEEQAAEAAERLRDVRAAGVDITGVVTSDLVRARRTGEIVAGALGLGPVVVCPDLREYDVGHWSGLTKPEIEKRWPGQQAEWFGGRLPTTPGGEGRAHFDRRVMKALLAGADCGLLSEAGCPAVADPGAALLVITHGGVIRSLERAVGAAPIPIANLTGRWFEIVGGADGPARPGAGEPITLVGADHRTASPSA